MMAVMYREQDPEALRTRVSELEAENAKLRKKRGEAIANAAPPIVVSLLVVLVAGVGFGTLRGCVREDAACDVACASQNAACLTSSDDGFACTRHRYRDNEERLSVPRRAR
jgi:hypothetical protein